MEKNLELKVLEKKDEDPGSILLINKKTELEKKLKEKNEILRKLKLVKQYKSRVFLRFIAIFQIFSLFI